MNIVFITTVGTERPFVTLMVDSVKDTMPDAKLIQISPPGIRKIRRVDELFNVSYNGNLCRYLVEAKYLCGLNEFIALDDDVIVKRPLYHLMDGDFDIKLTNRSIFGDGANDFMKEVCPFNVGVTVTKNRAFWKDASVLISTYTDKWQNWGGDQLAVCDLAKSGKYNVEVVDGRFYNRTPKFYENPDKIKDVYVWHYKGDRKKWMEALCAVH